MAANSYYVPTSGIVQRSLDIPFAITGVMYGLSGIYKSLDEKKHNFIRAIFIIVTLLILGILLYINILVPDKIQT